MIDKYPVEISNAHKDNYIWKHASNPGLSLTLDRDFDASRLPEHTKAVIYSEAESFEAWQL